MNTLSKWYGFTFFKFSVFAALLCVALLDSQAYARPNAPSDVSGSIAGNNATIIWSHVENADGYNVYIDNNYVATTFENQHTAPIDSEQPSRFYIISFTKNPIEFSTRSEVITLPAESTPTDLTIPPSIPTGLSGTINGTDVTLSWEPSTDDEAVAGYNVYRNQQYLTTVFDTQYSGKVEAGERYTFSIVAFDTRVNFSRTSERVSLPTTESGNDNTPENVPVTDTQNNSTDNSTDNKPDTTIDAATPVDSNIPPSTPTGLNGTITNNSNDATVSLSWDASTDDGGVKGYNVYENGNYKTTVLTTQYTGTVDRDTAYSYYIVAFDYDNNFATRTSRIVLPDDQTNSNQPSASQNPGEDNQAPASPSNLVGTWSQNGETADIALSWTAATDNIGVVGYNVYENKRYVSTVHTPAFTTTVNANGSYSYRIVAFDEARNYSAPSFSENLPDGGNQPPEFEGLRDYTAFAGDEISILIKPVDNDGATPGLYIGTLPTGMRSVDNFDGTRSLRWSPLQPDVGTYDITVTAFDSVDTAVKTVRTFSLTLELPEDQSSIRNEPPGIDQISEQITRVGDTIRMPVKATDPNGTIPQLTLSNLPDGANFRQHPDDPNIKVLTWTTNGNDLGLKTFNFVATDSVDANLRASSDVHIDVVNPDQFKRSGERLKDLGSRKDLLVGYASLLNFNQRADTDLYKATAAAEFNLVTAENSMKWSYVNPEPGEYRFDAADELVEFTNDNNMKLHGHTLVWYAALPQWVQKSEVSEREGLMNDFIDVMTKRYHSVDIWDVVNEAFEDDGSYRNSVWYQAMGEDHINKAFKRARAGAPNAQLIYNDYDIAAGGVKTDATYSLIENMIRNDVPIDGVGFQMHIDADFTDFSKVTDTFERFANLGIDIYITELDVSVVDGTNENDQANVYENVARVCLAQAACKALQIWGITDRYSWLRNNTPLPFDRDYQPKAAYWSLQRVLGE